MPTNKTRELLQAFCRLVLVHLFTCTLVCCWSYVAVEVSVCGGRVSVPQSDGVIRRTGEEGGWRQTGLRRIRQLRIHLKRKNTNRFTTTPEYIYTHKYISILNKPAYIRSLKLQEQHFWQYFCCCLKFLTLLKNCWLYWSSWWYWKYFW